MGGRERQIDIDQVVAVVATGGWDFGRDKLASFLPCVLWSVENKTVLERMIGQFIDAGVKQIVVCFNGDTEIIKNALPGWMAERVKFIDEPLPVGTAGCVREAAKICKGNYYALYCGAMVMPPDIKNVIPRHIEEASELTVFLHKGRQTTIYDSPAGVYMLDSAAVEAIPMDGYCDIKERLIPMLWRKGMSCKAIELESNCGAFRNRSQYLNFISGYVGDGLSENYLISSSAMISKSAKLVGHVRIMENVRIGDGVVVVGPSVIESDCDIAADVIINSSILWAGAKVNERAYMARAVATCGAIIAKDAIIEDSVATDMVSPIRQRVAEMLADRIGKGSAVFADGVKIWNAWAGILWLAAVLFVLLWSYWPEATELGAIWTRSDEYSSGMLVPMLAGYVIWARRGKLANAAIENCYWGIALLGLAQLIRFFGLVFMYASAQRLSLVLSVAGVVWFLLGSEIFKKMIPVMLFLILMLPMPRSIHNRIMLPLQQWSTTSAVFSLEMLGYEVWHEGNVIHIDNVNVAVAEACNGLRMLTAFFMISALVVLVVEMAWWAKPIILLSALPIALVCNTIRLTATAAVFTVIQGPTWEKLFHDFGGVAMMPLAIAMIVAEIWILGNLVVSAANQTHGECV